MLLTNKQIKKFNKEFDKNQKQADFGKFKFIIVLDNLKTTYNIGKIIRSAHCLGAFEVHLIGTKEFNVSPAKGAFKYTKCLFFNKFKDSYTYLIENQYNIFALHPDNGLKLGVDKLPLKTAFVCGHEEYGFSFPIFEFNHVKPLNINQVGSTQSLNASVATSIAMYEYVRQYQ